jgi:hypothetical protein
VSLTASPIQNPATWSGSPSRCATPGNVSSASVPKIVMVPTATLTSRLRASSTGAVAMIAELPHTAVPTPSSVASVGATPASRLIAATVAKATAMVTTTTARVGAPIAATSAKVSRAPSRITPSRRTRFAANPSPGAAPAGSVVTLATRRPSTTAISTGPIVGGSGIATTPATAATSPANASPGSAATVAAALERTGAPARGSGAFMSVPRRPLLLGGRPGTPGTAEDGRVDSAGGLGQLTAARRRAP